MLLKFIKLCVVFIIIGGGLLLYNRPEIKENIFKVIPQSVVSNLPDVKGISTQKSSEISNRVKSDIDSGIKEVQKKALDIKISDIVNFVNRSQKITGDFRAFQEFAKEQIGAQFNHLKNKY